MANPEHLAILERGVEAWNQWREEEPDTEVNLGGADLKGADLSGVDLSHASLAEADFLRADLSHAELSHANLFRANLSHANLSHANLFRAHLFAAHLMESNLSQAALSGANLAEADLSQAVLSGAKLLRANLFRAHLRGAQLGHTDLGGAQILRADLTNAHLHGVNLSRTNLRAATLVGADLSHAHLYETPMVDLDLRSVHGLDLVEHRASNLVSTSTLAMSGGQISETFLKGCGLQDWEIVSAKLYDPNLSTAEITDLQYEVFRLRTTRPIMVNNLFISYSHDDTEFVDALGKKLDKRGIRYWRDIHDMTAGRIETQIDRAMRLHPVVLIVLSEGSVNKPWVEWEAKKAQDLERDLRDKETPKDVLLPVALDNAWKTCHWPGWLRHQIEQFNVLPFEGWEDPAVMDRQFEKVLAGLPLYGPKSKPELAQLREEVARLQAELEPGLTHPPHWDTGPEGEEPEPGTPAEPDLDE